MAIRNIKTYSLREAMLALNPGDQMELPEGHAVSSARMRRAELNREGYRFGTRTIDGKLIITRYK